MSWSWRTSRICIVAPVFAGRKGSLAGARHSSLAARRFPLWLGNMSVHRHDHSATHSSLPRRGGELVPSTPVARYFSLHAGVGLAGSSLSGSESEPNSDVFVARHHNGICVVCLSPKHPAILRGGVVNRVEFRPASRAVVGKKKRGGVFLERDSRLATVTTTSGGTYTVHAAVRGVLVETNARLDKNPALVSSHPLTNGYLAVILPRPTERKTSTDHLMAVP